MNEMMLVMAAVAAIDPARVRLVVRTSVAAARMRAMVVGALVAMALVAVLAWAGDGIQSWLSVRPESWRIAAGIVAGFTGVSRLIAGDPKPEPVLRGVPSGLVPVAFPVLLTPVVAMLAVAGGVDVGAPLTGAAVGAALVLGVVSVMPGDSGGERLWLALSRLAGALLVVVAVTLVISGIADI